MKKILIVLIAFLAAYGGWRYWKKGAILDDAELSGKLEAAVDEVLAANGLRDSDVVSVERRERKKNLPIPVSWVETEREIRVRDAKTLDRILAGLRKVADAQKLFARIDSASPHKVFVEIRKDSRVFQSLRFRLSAARAHGAKEPRAAVIIDDVAGRGSDLEKIGEFFDLGIPITFAVLPMEKESAALAKKIHETGHEVILHQPMEPEDLAHNNPGKAALLVAMSESEIADKLEKNLAAVPQAAGVSNHMGSRFTAEKSALRHLFQSLKKMNQGGKNLYFFDSHTSPKLPSLELADELGIPHAANDVFLDNEDDPAAMERQLETLLKRAQRRGQASAIGHIQRQHTARALKRAIPKFKDAGVEFVFLSDIARSGSDVRKLAGKDRAGSDKRKAVAQQ